MDKLLILLLAFMLVAADTTAQYEDLVMEDYVYVTNIKSVSLSPLGQTLSPAVTYLNGGVTLELTYDDMDADQKDYTFDVIHCDRNWQPSNLQKQEYIDGFVNEEVDQLRFSIGTFVPYTNYRMQIPNADMSILLSGNYVLVIYEGEEDEDRFPIITRRFVVVDNKVRLETKARRPLDVLKSYTHQEFDLIVNNEDYPIIDPMLYLRASVVQNNNWNTSIDTLVPRIALGDRIIVDNIDKISFPGLKEFRSLDIRSLDIVSQDVHSIDLHDEGTDVLVELGLPRVGETYRTYPDADGAFVLANRDTGGSAIQADYANVIFTLETAELTEPVYVTGKFTDWLPEEQYRMEYDDYRGIYIAEIEMKQGFYDYMFAVERDGLLYPEPIEGSSFETQNYYQVFIYVREPGDRYDRLVGYTKFTPSYF